MSSPSSFRVEQITPERLLTIGVNILMKAFHDGPRLDAKRRFQFIMDRKPVFLLDLELDSGSQVRVVLTLERSELQGRLNFSLFRQLIGQLLVNYSQVLEQGKSLNLFSDDENRRWVFLHPALCRTDQGLNALALAMDMSHIGEMQLELMFLDPRQFERGEAVPAG